MYGLCDEFCSFMHYNTENKTNIQFIIYSYTQCALLMHFLSAPLTPITVPIRLFAPRDITGR